MAYNINAFTYDPNVTLMRIHSLCTCIYLYAIHVIVWGEIAKTKSNKTEFGRTDFTDMHRSWYPLRTSFQTISVNDSISIGKKKIKKIREKNSGFRFGIFRDFSVNFLKRRNPEFQLDPATRNWSKVHSKRGRRNNKKKKK